jgi:hypothetical protein
MLPDLSGSWGTVTFWYARQQTQRAIVVKPDAARPAPDTRKSPSKQRHDHVRAIRRDRIFAERRQERLRLFGYVILATGQAITLDEALGRVRLSLTGKDENGQELSDTERAERGLTPKQILEWHQPEIYHDVVESKGEVDAVTDFPALGIFPGVVLWDTKLRHRDPALR